jgi:flagellar operon protein (TIGR03826 family)
MNIAKRGRKQMSTAQLGNCIKCGKLFLRLRDICNDCYQKQEDDFNKTSAYLRDEPGSTIQEVSEATNVSVAQIRQFILEGRILVGQFTNLSYPCEICGSMIRTGRTCKSCMESLNELHFRYENEKSSKERNEQTGGYITKYL